jgi:hypothetical protein
MGYKGTKHKHPKTHCKYGHEFTTENTYVTKRGERLCRTCCIQRTNNFIEKHRDSVNKKRRARRKLLTKEERRKANLQQLGWTLELWKSKLKKQKGKCAICKKVLTFEDKITGSRGCADHLHTKPPKPRGILCTNCNLGIGNLQENYKIMEAAIAYVKEYQEG